jgi:hypothetical protein
MLALHQSCGGCVNAVPVSFCVCPLLSRCRLVALDANFKKLEDTTVLSAYRSTSRRLLLLDYDGTLIPHRNISAAPPAEVGGECVLGHAVFVCVVGRGVPQEGGEVVGKHANLAVCVNGARASASKGGGLKLQLGSCSTVLADTPCEGPSRWHLVKMPLRSGSLGSNWLHQKHEAMSQGISKDHQATCPSAQSKLVLGAWAS